MKIAVFEPYPRMCGVTTWSFHVAQGFRDAGHSCDVVSFTKSGRARKNSARRRDGSLGMGWHWWHEKPDVVGKWSDAPSILDTYDLIVLNEPKNGTSDREAQKNKLDVPDYVDALRKTSTSWMTILHAPQYDENRGPFLDVCLDAGNFIGVAIEHQPGSYASGSWAFDGRIKSVQEWPWLPYRVKTPYDDEQRYRVIGIAGRMIPNKGHTGLAYFADQYPAGWRTWLYGAESGGSGPCFSWNLYEAMTRYHGWQGARPGKPENPFDDIGNSGDLIHGWPWWLSKNDRIIEYKSTYDDPFRIWHNMGVAVNLTSRNFAVGLEYTMLEAMNAGCAIVMPSYCFTRTGAQQYHAYTLDKWTAAPGISTKTGIRTHNIEEGVGEELVGQVTTACHAFEAGEHGAAQNLWAIENYHNPVHLARQILNLL